MDQAGRVWAHYKAPILLGLGSLLLTGISVVLLVKSTQTATPIEFSEASVSAAPKIAVDVAGAVRQSGVYHLDPGARVEDALVAAGGLTVDADSAWIAKNLNRALKISDGMKVYIPRMSEPETSHNLQTVVTTPGASSSNGFVISINMSSQSDLESLTGVGPATAQKIIDNRPYANLDELVQKKAISQSLFEKLKSQLSL